MCNMSYEKERLEKKKKNRRLLCSIREKNEVGISTRLLEVEIEFKGKT